MAAVVDRHPLPAHSSDRLPRAQPLLVLAILLGIITRAVPVFSTDFPLNDGGLFSVMSADLRENGYLLPGFTTYNAADIPFAYPPLGLYLDAVFGQPFLGTETSLRFLPLFLACASVPSFYFMVRALVADQDAALATLAWALMPGAWMWQVTGGGITRSLGMVFAFLAVGMTIRLLQKENRRRWLLASILCGLTLMSHPEASAFVATSLVVIAAAFHRQWRSLGTLVAVVAGAFLIAAPWWLTVVLTHGPDALMSAGQSRLMSIPVAVAILLNLQFTGEAYISVGAVLGAVGFSIAIVTRRWWLIGWLVGTAFVLPGAFATYGLVAWSLVIAIAIRALASLTAGRDARAVGIGVLTLATATSLWARYENSGLLTSLSADQRDAIAWTQQHTPTDAAFIVVTGSDWPTDANAEWFPALADRRSVGTVQGLEFTSGARWDRAIAASAIIEECAETTVDCLFAESSAIGPFDYVFIPRGHAPGIDTDQCCKDLIASLASDDRFLLRSELPGGWTFEHLHNPSGNTSQSPPAAVGVRRMVAPGPS